jgi:hypothetical protein
MAASLGEEDSNPNNLHNINNIIKKKKNHPSTKCKPDNKLIIGLNIKKQTVTAKSSFKKAGKIRNSGN